ncbi:MAG: hypothetical protein HZB38_05455 [Planctomycetes bacterium]|nr:hypothetical protein [Planctomycetota bacterium]
MRSKPRQTAGNTPNGGSSGPLLLGGLGFALTIAGALLAWAALGQLPMAQVAGVDREALRAGYVELLRTSPATPVNIRSEILQTAMATPTSQFGRLQVVAMLIAQGYARDQSPDVLWPTIKPYLEGLEGAKLDSLSGAFELTAAEANHLAPMHDGTARQAAANMEDVHAPVLEFLFEQLQRLRTSRSAAGDTAGAALCTSILRHLLADWTLESGRVTLRLLAADLLARELEGDRECAGVVAALRAFRKAYRDAARQRPEAVLGVGSEPNLCPAEHLNLVRSVAAVFWTLLATFVSGALAVGFFGVLLFKPAGARGGGALALGAIAAVASLVVLILTVQTPGGALIDDVRYILLRHLSSPPATNAAAARWASVYYAQLPRAALLTTLFASAAAALASWLIAEKTRRVSCVAMTLLTLWVVTGTGCVAAGVWGRRALNQYETALAKAHQAGVLTSLTGLQGEDALRPVRVWRAK